MTDVYIFDFGKVLMQFDPEYMTRAFINNNDDLNLAKDVIFDRLYWDRLDAGTITDEEVIEGIKSRLPKRIQALSVEAYKNWYRNLTPIDGMKEILEELKKSGKKLCLLSNISKGFSQNYKSVPYIKELLSLFDCLVFSADIGLTKPSAEIFNYLLDKNSLKASDCTFIDDSQKNINGAAALGIKAYLFDGDSTKLRHYIFD